MTVSYRNYELNSEPVSSAAVVPARHQGPYARYGKRAVDIVLVLLALPAVVPMVLLFAVIIALDGHNPFYTQSRVGLNNRVFRMWKLRSMVPNAKEKLGQYLSSNPAARAEWNETQKLRNDPRITAIGGIIRKFSIDELPQLWNVLKGDMSIVGPRPMMTEQRCLYPGKAYYRLRPGITGPWQVSERNQTSFAARAIFDEDYEKSLTARTDLQLMLKTVSVIIRGTGC
ncbi:sugar transferase [Ostreiculturibacter nitratireducens]|uniref:sugar transferase n=1 Tax=Ostreiculturibacter nitratireducens TaxID=3075226 RepID=UPI0031B570E4